MLVFSRKVHNLRYLGFGDLVCKNAAFADAVMMHMQHDRGRGFNVLVEEQSSKVAIFVSSRVLPDGSIRDRGFHCEPRVQSARVRRQLG